MGYRLSVVEQRGLNRTGSEADGGEVIPKGFSGALLVFCNDLEAAAREAAPEELPGLREAGAVYRADTLFEAGADLSDALLGVEQGRLGADVARQEALKVCRLAVLLWLSTLAEEEAGDA